MWRASAEGLKDEASAIESFAELESSLCPPFALILICSLHLTLRERESRDIRNVDKVAYRDVVRNFYDRNLLLEIPIDIPLAGFPHGSLRAPSRFAFS